MAANAPVLIGATLSEQPNSPEWQLNDRTRCVRKFKGNYNACLAALPFRGEYGTGAYSSMMVWESHIAKERGYIGILTVIMVGVFDTQPLPPPQVSLENNIVVSPIENAGPWKADLDLCDAGGGVFFEIYRDSNWVLSTIKRLNNGAQWGGDDYGMYHAIIALGYLMQLMDRKAKGEHFIKLRQPVLSITTYGVFPPALNAGGYLENPQPYLPEYPLVGSYSIPTVGATGTPAIQYIRNGDRSHWNGCYYELTQSWQGDQYPDPDLYPSE